MTCPNLLLRSYYSLAGADRQFPAGGGDAFTARGAASPAAIRSGGEWWIYHSNGLVRTRDFWSFTEVPLPAGTRPVSVVEVPRALAAAMPR